MKNKINTIDEMLKHQKVIKRTECSSLNENISRKKLLEMARATKQIDKMKKDKLEGHRRFTVIPPLRDVLIEIDENPTKKAATHNGR